MKISTKGRYGLRAVLDLVLYSKGGDHVSLISIAERQDISKSYLEQVFSALRKAGIVKSVKGAQGGYTLAGDPSTITVGMILRALEGDLSVVGEAGNETNKIELYVREHVWEKIDAKINEVIDGLTLKDMAEDYEKKSDVWMYYI